MMRLSKAGGLLGLALLATGGALRAAWASNGGIDDNFRVAVSVQELPAAITMRWDFPFPNAGTLFRRPMGANDGEAFEPVSRIPRGASSIIDFTAQVGVAYEYKIGLNPIRQPVVAAGIGLPLVESRGKIVLIVDQTQAGPAAAELRMLQQDLVGDGWRVIRHDVPRDDGNYSSRNQVRAVRDLIVAAYNADRANVRAVLLFGHVPVPYCGFSRPDGHEPRALPCDGYYGDMDGTYTDTRVNQMIAGNPRGSNVPGDGKLDQDSFASAVDLMVGRVDLYNMPAFGDNETALLKRYLAKDHAWRHSRFTVGSNSLLNWTRGWHWGVYNSAYLLTDNVYSFASGGSLWNFNGSDLSGAPGDYLRLMSRRSNLFGFIGSTGGNDNAGGLNTGHMAAHNVLVPFMLQGGSYSLDWDQGNNLMRSFLAASGYAICGGWSEFPSWYLHHMGADAPIGLSARATQNNDGAYYEIFNGGLQRGAFLALHGDPTLRMFNVAPPSQLSAAAAGGGVELRWMPSAEAGVGGYHVYRADSLEGEFTRLNRDLVGGTSFTDSTPRRGDVVYMVRAATLRSSPTASFWGLSQGAFAPMRMSGMSNRLPTANPQTVPGGATVNITLTGTDPDGDPLVYVLNESTVNGRLSGAAPNLTYTPYDGNVGSDRLTFTVHDAWGASAPATVTIGMAPAVMLRQEGMSGSVTNLAFVPVTEGGTSSFQVRLSAPPMASTTVTVARAMGDMDLSVRTGASLTFTPTNWNVEQTVTLAAAEDSDAESGFATIACSAPGFATANARAVEDENEITLRVVAGRGGTVTPSGPSTITKRTPVPLRATPNSGFVFSHWAYTNTATMMSDLRVARARFDNPYEANTNLTADMGGPWTEAGVTATANFIPEANATRLTILAGPGGTVFPSGTINVQQGAVDIAASAIPDMGQRFVGWTVVSGPGTLDNMEAATVSLRTLTGPTSIRADFRVEPGAIRPDAGVSADGAVLADGGGSSVDAGSAVSDGGAMPMPGAVGCGCRVASPTRPTRWTCSLLALVALACGRRRKGSR
jgi:hypothetical protein